MKQSLIISFLFILVGLCLAGYEYQNFVNEEITKMEAERGQLESQLSTKQAEVRRLRDFSENIQKVKQEIKELNLQLDALMESMPKTFNLSGLLRKINLVAQNSGIEISTFKPNTGAAARNPTEAKADGSFYAAIGVDFQIKGPFAQSVMFFDQLSRMKRIVHVESIRMRPATRSSETGSIRGGAVSASTDISIRTYRFTE